MKSSLQRSRQIDRSSDAHQSRQEGKCKPDGYVLRFGKHKGMAICNVPPNYLKWMMKQDFEAKILGHVKRALRRRKNKKPEDAPLDPHRQKHTEADWEDTHTKWTGPTGLVEWIPNEIDIEAQAETAATF